MKIKDLDMLLPWTGADLDEFIRRKFWPRFSKGDTVRLRMRRLEIVTVERSAAAEEQTNPVEVPWLALVDIASLYGSAVNT